MKNQAKPEDKKSAERSAGEGVSTGIPAPEEGLGRRLREARERLDLNVSQLCERTKTATSEKKGLSRAVISGYENNAYKPGTRELRILCDSLQVSPNWLVYGIEDPLQPGTTISKLFGTDRPEMAIAKLVYAMTSFPKEEFESISTLIMSIATKDKALITEMKSNENVMGRLINIGMSLEFSEEWTAIMNKASKKTDKRMRAFVKNKIKEKEENRK